MPPTPDQPTIAVHIVTWNSLLHLPFCLESIGKQTRPADELLLVDNASVDGTVRWLEAHYPHLNLLRNTRNLGFCRGHNQAIRLSGSQFVLLLNPDVILSPDWLERGLRFMPAHPEYGSYGGKLLRYQYSQDELKEVQRSDIIDSTGLRVLRSRHALDRGSGQPDRGQWSAAGPVFGHSGACVLWRRRALNDLRWQEEYLDEHMFAYKDDIDLAWRAQRMGWPSWYDPAAIAFHYRRIRGQDRSGDLALASNYRARQNMVSFYSYRNHLALLLKMETGATFWRDGLWIIWHELKKFAWLIMTRPGLTLKALPQVLRQTRLRRRQGAWLNRHARVSAVKVRSWFIAP